MGRTLTFFIGLNEAWNVPNFPSPAFPNGSGRAKAGGLSLVDSKSSTLINLVGCFLPQSFNLLGWPRKSPETRENCGA